MNIEKHYNQRFSNMAPITSVMVLTPNGRRMNIKVEPNTTLMKILEDVCKKHEFEADDYDLKHHNKVLDLNMQVRYSGLPNNAGLEMYPVAKKRIQSNVVILIQTENGTRHTGTFLPSDSVWHIVSSVCGEVVTAMKNPVLIFTRTELCGQEKMQNTSLKLLGLTGGRAMFRLLDRTEEQLRQQANVSAPLPRAPPPPSPPPTERKPHPLDLIKAAKSAAVNQKETADEPVAGPSWAADSESKDISPISSSPPKKTRREISPPNIPKIDPIQQQELDKEIEKELVSLGERDAVVFNRMASNPQQAIDELPDDFFELSLEDAKRLLRDLKKKREEMENMAIKTSAMRELEENKHKLMLLQKYKHTVLRIYFPDATVLQAAFKPVEPVAAVYDFVRKHLQEPECEFELYTAPPRTVLQSEDRLIELGLVPGAIIHFSSSASTYLKQELLESLSSPAAALLAARRSKSN